MAAVKRIRKTAHLLNVGIFLTRSVPWITYFVITDEMKSAFFTKVEMLLFRSLKKNCIVLCPHLWLNLFVVRLRFHVFFYSVQSLCFQSTWSEAFFATSKILNQFCNDNQWRCVITVTNSYEVSHVFQRFCRVKLLANFRYFWFSSSVFQILTSVPVFWMTAVSVSLTDPALDQRFECSSYSCTQLLWCC